MKQLRFPFPTALDFSPLVDLWREQADDPSSPWHGLAEDVLRKAGDVPALNGPIDDPAVLNEHVEALESLMRAFSAPLGVQRPMVAIEPWQMIPVYQSPMAAETELLRRTGEHFEATYDFDEMSNAMVMKAYGVILEDVYGVGSRYELPFSWVSFRDVDGTIPIPCPVTHVTRRFAVEFDARFVRAEVIGERPEVDLEVVSELAADPTQVERLMELLPPEHFRFRGVSLLMAEDVTEEAALTAIRDDLLLKDALTSEDGLVHIQEHVRAFLGRADLELGLIGFGAGETVEALIDGQVIGRSLLMSEGVVPECPTRADSHYAKALTGREPIVIDDLEALDGKTGFEWHLSAQGLRSLMVLPLVHEEGTVGVLELASPTPKALNRLNVYKLEKIQGLFALGMKRSLEELEDRIQAIIKRDYTAIHPVVEWRFRRAARNRMKHELRGETKQAEEIVLPGLIPLYGLTDVRSSSAIRNRVIVADLLTQLQLAARVIEAAQSERPQPALGQLGYRLDRYAESLHPEMATEDESSILSFLQNRIEPLFDELAGLGTGVAEAVERYRDAIDPELGMLYDQRQKFEESVGLVNEIVAQSLHDQDRYAQSLVPHYFELFKTDGVDYNIYVGAGLHEARDHEALDLANLRLWQLMAMCRIGWALEEQSDALPMPLEATHLVLAQSMPISVRFRRDEKRFDVDGAYNVRYEIVKKRIDKALIRGTGERLTQPGKLAIAHSQDQEAIEYRGYLEYLRSAGFVEGEIEELELEDLQGVFGLRALRVDIAPAPAATQEVPLTETVQAAVRRLSQPAG